MLRKPVLLFAALSLFAACGDSGDDDDDNAAADAGVDCATIMAGQDEYTPGLEKVGANGYTVHLMSATPAPPAKGDNTWMIHVNDPTPEAAVGLDITVDTWMPHHMHGSPITAEVTEMGDPGMYEVTPVNLFMPGVWEVTIDMNDGTTDLDDVTYTFCIDG